MTEATPPAAWTSVVGAALSSKRKIKEELQALAANDSNPPIIVLNPPHLKYKFKCGGCDKLYRTSSGWSTHLPCIGKVDISIERRIPCHRCHRKFQEPRDLAVHLADHPKVKHNSEVVS
jgi:hypothetical protein